MTTTTTTTHTPGPWHYGELSAAIYSHRAVPTAAGSTYAHIATMNEDMDTDTLEANARLIAAAPDLRACLANLVRRVDDTPVADGSNLNTAWAHALLASIDGQTEPRS